MRDFFVHGGAMEKGYRLVKCPGIDCPATLRLTVSEADYGKIVEVMCPKCLTKCRTTIPTPTAIVEEEPGQDFSFVDTLKETFGDLFGESGKK